MKSIRTILIANRGEIALRVIRTCRDMGLSTVAVFSDADSDAPFVRAADEAVRIGPPPVRESYLSVERILAAAARTSADAIHPGYGFLSENAEFAEAVEQAGLIFIGPSPESIRLMGSKAASKRLMTEAGVPVIPGYEGGEQDTPSLVARARAVGFPLLVKASAGGGGKGMRLVRDERTLATAIDAARREALSAFGDGTLLIELYIEDPRHIEIQVLGDTHGTVLHLYERECSIQRRHQKIIEETPSVALTPALRAEMGAVAVRAASAIAYRGAGTVELILAPDGSFYFLEMNTRLQVEHPVTELVTGIDLVHEQIRVARGEPLGYGQEDVRQRGAAVEARLYAEDPGAGFLPATGTLLDWHLPPLPGIRVDAGVETGSVVGIHYDPMLAKIIAWGETRREATSRLVRALQSLSAQGVVTNRDLLISVLTHEAYEAGTIDTHFIERHLGPTPGVAPSAERDREAAIAATIGHCLARKAHPRVLPRVLAGWRNSMDLRQKIEWSAGGGPIAVTWRETARGRYSVHVADAASEVLVVDHQGPALTLEICGLRRRFRVVTRDEETFVHGRLGSVRLVETPRFAHGEHEERASGCVAPMPGRVLEVRVREGDRVAQGQVVVTLEAMKMEHAVTAPLDAAVTRVLVAPGDQVDAGALLVDLEVTEGTGESN